MTLTIFLVVMRMIDNALALTTAIVATYNKNNREVIVMFGL
jgi:hypothetical protein